MSFGFEKTPLEGVLIVQPRRFEDSRGFFMESYKKSDFISTGINEDFVQDNHSFSSKGVLRGLHFQREPYAQGKLVRVVKGAVWDVAVDIRPSSPFFSHWFGLELTEENSTMLYLPPGFAHGFLTLRDNTHFLYKCTAEYVPEADGGLCWDDPDIGIDWPLEIGQVPVVSGKDSMLPSLKELV